ncbi:MAG: hypothetical protein LBL46_04770 [Rickettsiales bacterium]|jgi:hypothetical protein|nr:hypothetical protein [Rickettsiales bacterium]
MALWEADVDAANRTVVYNDGLHEITKSGGSISWRTNNPGNLSYGSEAAAIKYGAIGAYPLNKWNYGVFPTEEAGQKALEDWLNKHGNETVSEAMNRYAPPEDNDTGAYREHLASKLDIDQHIKDLSEKQMADLTAAIKQHEGFISGNETERLSDDLKIKNDEQLKALMNDPAYQDPDNPRFDDTQKAVKDYFDDKYPGDMKSDGTGKMRKQEKVYVWHTEIGENTCDECEALDGTIFDSLDEIPALPPLHENCRCSIAVEYINED